MTTAENWYSVKGMIPEDREVVTKQRPEQWSGKRLSNQDMTEVQARDFTRATEKMSVNED